MLFRLKSGTFQCRNQTAFDGFFFHAAKRYFFFPFKAHIKHSIKRSTRPRRNHLHSKRRTYWLCVVFTVCGKIALVSLAPLSREMRVKPGRLLLLLFLLTAWSPPWASQNQIPRLPFSFLAASHGIWTMKAFWLENADCVRLLTDASQSVPWWEDCFPATIGRTHLHLLMT